PVRGARVLLRAVAAGRRRAWRQGGRLSCGLRWNLRVARRGRRADRAEHGQPDAEPTGRGPVRPVHRGHARRLQRGTRIAGIRLTSRPCAPATGGRGERRRGPSTTGPPGVLAFPPAAGVLSVPALRSRTSAVVEEQSALLPGASAQTGRVQAG